MELVVGVARIESGGAKNEVVTGSRFSSEGGLTAGGGDLVGVVTIRIQVEVPRVMEVRVSADAGLAFGNESLGA